MAESFAVSMGEAAKPLFTKVSLKVCSFAVSIAEATKAFVFEVV